jgi:hypothetical protein
VIRKIPKKRSCSFFKPKLEVTLMLPTIRFGLSLAGCVSLMSLPLLAQATTRSQPLNGFNSGERAGAIAQTRPAPTRTEFEGRGVAHGSVFSRGRNVNGSLTINQGRFDYNIAQPPGTRIRVRYQGAVARQTPGSTPNSFVLDGRVQTFDSSASTRIFNNTTGTCRIEVFDARVISSTCRSVAPDSKTDFLGLEQF